MIKDFIIDHNKSLKDALVLINKNARGILFVIKKKQLVGVVTDGDIRRNLIDGLKMRSFINKVMNKDFIYLKANTPKEKINKIFKDGIKGKKNKNHKNIKCIPLVNNRNEIVDLVFNLSTGFIPVFEPNLSGNEQKYLIDCLKSNWISSKGPYIDKFEKIFQELHSGYYALTASSGTTALHLSLAAEGIGPGDEVIVPDLTFAASINTIIHCGATPVIVDVNKKTWTIDPKKIDEVISKKTKAIMPVHLFGHACEMDEISKIAKKNNLKIIEDCAEAHGVEYKGRKVGSIGDIGAFSFYANKTFTCGEGGMVVTNSKKLAEKAKSLKNLSYGKVNRFLHEDIGFNYRLPNISAALGLGQFLQRDKIFSEKKRIYARYKNNLKNTKGINIPIIKNWTTNYIMWVFNLYLDDEFPISRDELVKKLDNEKIETRNAFVPINKQKILIKKYDLYNENECPNANYIMDNGLYLPSGNNITNSEIDFICNKIKKISKL